jgi:Zn-dependent protease
MGYNISLVNQYINMIISLVSLLGLIISITIHEFSHALAADKLGDPTPRSYGRLTLNPLAHADPIGTFLLPLFSALSHIPTIGWAKPVPIDPYNFSNPRRDEILVALAGPGSNFIFAIIIALVNNFIFPNLIFSYLVLINLSLGIFNLIPIPPLDGSKIFLNLLPPETSIEWQHTFDRYGFFLLIILIFIPIGGSNLISLIITPFLRLLLPLLLPGLSF